MTRRCVSPNPVRNAMKGLAPCHQRLLPGHAGSVGRRSFRQRRQGRDLADQEEIGRGAQQAEYTGHHQWHDKRTTGDGQHDAGESRRDNSGQVRGEILDAADRGDVAGGWCDVAGQRPDARGGEREARVRRSQRTAAPYRRSARLRTA